MANKQYEILDRYGRVVEDDVIPDGGRLRVSMMMRDGMSEMQRSVADAKAMRDAAKRFGLRDAADLHRPGPRFTTDQAARARVEQARAEWIDEMTTAWQRQPAADVRGQMPGDQCTIDGQPGHLDHRLRCVPDERQDSVPRTMSLADAQRMRDEAYRQYCDELVNAWKAR